MYNEIIKLRLIDERKKSGFSQQEVANQTGINDSVIAKIEVGNRKVDVETIGTLATFYNVTTDWLFGIGPRTPYERAKQC